MESFERTLAAEDNISNNIENKKITLFRFNLIFVAAALMTSYVIGEVISTNNVEITFVNVGQGDGAVIQAPYRFNVLIDGGGGNSYSDNKGRQCVC